MEETLETRQTLARPGSEIPAHGTQHRRFMVDDTQARADKAFAEFAARNMAELQRQWDEIENGLATGDIRASMHSGKIDRFTTITDAELNALDIETGKPEPDIEILDIQRLVQSLRNANQENTALRFAVKTLHRQIRYALERVVRLRMAIYRAGGQSTRTPTPTSLTEALRADSEDARLHRHPEVYTTTSGTLHIEQPDGLWLVIPSLEPYAGADRVESGLAQRPTDTPKGY
jgi:hypothetical protein